MTSLQEFSCQGFTSILASLVKLIIEGKKVGTRVSCGQSVALHFVRLVSAKELLSNVRL